MAAPREIRVHKNLKERCFRQPASFWDSPGHEKAPTPCQAGESSFVLVCRGGHLWPWGPVRGCP